MLGEGVVDRDAIPVPRVHVFCGIFGNMLGANHARCLLVDGGDGRIGDDYFGLENHTAFGELANTVLRVRNE